MKPVVAIDGPACSGKGTLARMIASHFDFIYLDTGILYRTIAYVGDSLIRLKNLSVKDVLTDASKLTKEQLRSEENSARASEIAKMIEMRDIITNMQRDFINLHKGEGLVLDGRDIGTVVVPDACCKLFITADLKERARRRLKDLKDKNRSFETVFNNMKLRDEQDRSRKVAPLICDSSYTVIDTTKQTVEMSFKACCNAVKQAFLSSDFRNLI